MQPNLHNDFRIKKWEKGEGLLVSHVSRTESNRKEPLIISFPLKCSCV